MKEREGFRELPLKGNCSGFKILQAKSVKGDRGQSRGGYRGENSVQSDCPITRWPWSPAGQGVSTAMSSGWKSPPGVTFSAVQKRPQSSAPKDSTVRFFCCISGGEITLALVVSHHKTSLYPVSISMPEELEKRK